MPSAFLEFFALGGWALLCVLLGWATLIRVWSRISGERDVEANLIIMGLTILWALGLYLWT